MARYDVNVLVYARRADTPDHEACREWPEKDINGSAVYGVSDGLLSGFLRVVTHPRGFDPPGCLDDGLAFARQVRRRPNAVLLRPGNRHWSIFTHLCEAADGKGNLIPDAFLAALAIESGSEWVTTDRDFTRFPGLSWRHPLDE